MKLKDLKKSITDMSDEELTKQIMEIRESRRTKKKVVERKAKGERKKSKKGLTDLMNKLTPDEVQALLGALTEDD